MQSKIIDFRMLNNTVLLSSMHNFSSLLFKFICTSYNGSITQYYVVLTLKSFFAVEFKNTCPWGALQTNPDLIQCIITKEVTF